MAEPRVPPLGLPRENGLEREGERGLRMAREYRRLSASDLEMVLHLNETYRQDFASPEAARAFLCAAAELALCLRGGRPHSGFFARAMNARG